MGCFHESTAKSVLNLYFESLANGVFRFIFPYHSPEYFCLLLSWIFLFYFIFVVEPFVDGKTAKSFGTASTKKGGLATGTRKALNDITNKSTIHHEASSKKTALPKEEFNEAEEKFLHDHKKCIEAQRNALNAFQLEMVLPGIGKGKSFHLNVHWYSEIDCSSFFAYFFHSLSYIFF